MFLSSIISHYRNSGPKKVTTVVYQNIQPPKSFNIDANNEDINQLIDEFIIIDNDDYSEFESSLINIQSNSVPTIINNNHIVPHYFNFLYPVSSVNMPLASADKSLISTIPVNIADLVNEFVIINHNQSFFNPDNDSKIINQSFFNPANDSKIINQSYTFNIIKFVSKHLFWHVVLSSFGRRMICLGTLYIAGGQIFSIVGLSPSVIGSILLLII
jgi:hypothetical protein